MRVFVAVVLIMMLVPVVAQADIHYNGEIDNRNDPRWGGAEGNGLWDFDYWMDAPPSDKPFSFYISRWGIVCPVDPGVANMTAPSGWTVQWYPSIPNLSQLGAIQNRPGIVWTAITTQEQALAGFHFQTTAPYYPVQQLYDGDGTSWTGVTQYSANPEPASLALLGMMMVGGNIWRRRRNRK